MGTPMVVNLVNLFLGNFEREMLSNYEKTYGFKP